LTMAWRSRGRRIDPDAQRTPTPTQAVEGLPLPVTCVEPKDVVTEGHDLASAARVIGVGRGLRSEEDLALVDDLARVLGAEVACSRPVAEDLGWLPKDRYLGVSGRRIAPRLYLALGISGQLQHMIGVREAGTIVAINTDPMAPMIEDSDFSIIGDLKAVVPALIRELTRAR
jgi:electron transfer flavoprotein alpha subunit